MKNCRAMRIDGTANYTSPSAFDLPRRRTGQRLAAQGGVMIEEHVEIRTPDGMADAVVLRPDGPDSRPGVIALGDIRGIRPAFLDLARRVAGRGHVVLVPNV